MAVGSGGPRLGHLPARGLPAPQEQLFEPLRRIIGDAGENVGVARWPPVSESQKVQLRRPMAMPRIARSAALFDRR